jgi:hypothetical protein
MTPEERESILDKHKHVYNGYQTLQPNIPNPQPLFVQDYANDKEGITVSNKGNVMSYRNMNINENVERGKMCECGGMVYEGECTECGKAYEKYDVDIYDVEDLNPKNKFDYVEGKELDEIKISDLSFDGGDEKQEKEVKFKGMVKYKDGKPTHQFAGKDDISGTMLGVDYDDEISDIMPIDELESNYDFKAPAYQFKSDGPADAYDEDDKNDFSYGMAFSDMDDTDDWTDENILMSLRNDTVSDKSPGTDTSIDMDLDDVKEPYNFYSGGPGKSIGVYEEDEEEEDIEEMVDEDLKESFSKQKNKITEMFERMKKY